MDSEESDRIEKLFLKDKPAKMLVFLKEGENPNYATEVSKSVDCTYSHTIKVLDEFKELGLVEFEKKGRIKLIKLTEFGEDIAHDLEGLMRKFSRKTKKKRSKNKKTKKKKSEGKSKKD